MAKFVIQPHVRLQEWVAEEHGYFAAQGLDYEFESSSFAGGSQNTTAVGSAENAARDIRAGAFEDIERGRTSDVSSACHWVLNATASPETGKVWGRGYSIVPSGIFVQPDSPYKRPEHLAGVPVAVGYHSGSHYSAVQGLEPFIAKDAISLSFAGQPIDRVRLMLQGELQATNVFGAQFYLLAQLGFHKLIDTTFIVGFLLSPRTSTDDAERYFRALQKAQRDIDLQPELYKHHWLHELPSDLATLTDVRRYGAGERIVFEPYTEKMFATTREWMKSRGFLDPDVGVGPTAYAHAVVV
jgi:NitT/TauT family transport system substrate-binding protein